MKFTETKLKGAVIIEPELLKDERGFFARTFCQKEFKAHGLGEFFDDEVRKNVKKDEDSQTLEDELKYEDWYVLDQFHGTSEEKELIEFVKETIINLQNKYKEVYADKEVNMPKGAIITDDDRVIIAKVFLGHPEFRAKEIQIEVNKQATKERATNKNQIAYVKGRVK